MVNMINSGKFKKAVTEYLGLVIALICLIAVFSLLTKYFFSATTFITIANQIPSAVLIATGMTYILIIAEIDLSVGFCSWALRRCGWNGDY
jgi:ribose transport system permease protein